MAPVIPNPKKIKAFRSADAFEKWLSKKHDSETELWLKIHKKDSGLATVTYAEALDVALCWGWIDGLKKSFDEQSFLQRFTPRKAKSMWSQANRAHIARLTKAGRMTPRALKKFKALSRQNLFALVFRTNNMKTPAGRARKIEELVQMLERGETIVPQAEK